MGYGIHACALSIKIQLVLPTIEIVQHGDGSKCQVQWTWHLEPTPELQWTWHLEPTPELLNVGA